ncbi:putative ammonium transporter 3 isoform X2 [Oculina patagonica]
MNFTQNVSNAVNVNGTSSEPVQLNSDDATWILTSAFIIFTMQSGFGLVESGLVSQKNEVNIMVKNAVDVIYGGLSYWLYGFAFSFGTDEGTNGFSGIGCAGVHLVGGVAGLVAAIMLGPRLGRYDKSVKKGKPGSLTNVMLGTFMLWWGWLGFNCGSTFGISGAKWLLASRSAVVTLNGSIGGGILGVIYSFLFRKRKLDVAIFITAILGGLVGITAICAVCRPWEAFIIGFIGGLVACGSCDIIDRFKIDDPAGCIGTHAMAGIWGMIAVGLFVEEEPLEGFSQVRGLFKGGSVKLLGVQILACVVIAAWSGVTTWLQLFLINKILPLRLSYDQEMMGADKLEHGIDCNDSEDNSSDLEDNVLQAEEDGTDSYRGYITSDAPVHGYSAEMEHILSIQNLPGCVNYGLEPGETGSVTHRKIKSEVGIQVDLDDPESFC